MTRADIRADIRAGLLGLLTEIAPDVDAAHLDPTCDLRRAVDLDSLDIQTLLERIAVTTGVVIADADVAALRSLDQFTDYVERRSGGLP